MKLYADQACNKLMLDLQNADMMNRLSPASDRLSVTADELLDKSWSGRDTPAKAC